MVFKRYIHSIHGVQKPINIPFWGHPLVWEVNIHYICAISDYSCIKEPHVYYGSKTNFTQLLENGPFVDDLPITTNVFFEGFSALPSRRAARRAAAAADSPTPPAAPSATWGTRGRRLRARGPRRWGCGPARGFWNGIIHVYVNICKCKSWFLTIYMCKSVYVLNE